MNYFDVECNIIPNIDQFSLFYTVLGCTGSVMMSSITLFYIGTVDGSIVNSIIVEIPHDNKPTLGPGSRSLNTK